jgi:hypothetical protein
MGFEPTTTGATIQHSWGFCCAAVRAGVHAHHTKMRFFVNGSVAYWSNDQSALWLLAEGADSAAMSRSVPMTKALNDASCFEVGVREIVARTGSHGSDGNSRQR